MNSCWPSSIALCGFRVAAASGMTTTAHRSSQQLQPFHRRLNAYIFHELPAPTAAANSPVRQRTATVCAKRFRNCPSRPIECRLARGTRRQLNCLEKAVPRQQSRKNAGRSHRFLATLRPCQAGAPGGAEESAPEAQFKIGDRQAKSSLPRRFDYFDIDVLVRLTRAGTQLQPVANLALD